MLKYIILVILALSPLIVNASGTSGFEFLRTDFSPRSSSMAGSYVAMRSDVNGLFHNPAGLAYSEERQFMVNYLGYLLDINGGSIGFTQQIENIGRLSGAIIYFDYGNFDETDEFAVSTGRNFGASDLAFAVSLSNYLEDRFAYGVTLKYVHSKIDVFSASAFAFDFGLIYEAPFQDDLFIGFSMLNVGSAISAFQSTEERLPLSINFGVSKKLEHLPLVLNASIKNINEVESTILDRIEKFSIGGEFTLSSKLRLRLGYDNNLHKDLETTNGAGFSGVSLGLGFIFWENFRFDYGYSSMGDLGGLNRIGLSGTL
ncbi:MAG: PorV/PorQ family protein [Calditrichia bacterium]|nr:PorV/PorQ family protein [Calditrichia bacterium]